MPRFSRFDSNQEPETNIKTIQDEISYFGLSGVSTIGEIARKETKVKLTDIRNLRVMHCSELTSLKGLDAFSQVTDLNASSNNIISMAGVD